jgi:Transglycosylase SLT domain
MQAEAAASLGAERVVAALKSAAAATGSDFHYLLGTAMRESSLKPNAQSSTSSATGLFQFVDQTWLGLVKEHGAQHGLGNYAAAISKDGDGRYHADTQTKQSILALRKDPELSALMAGEYAKSTQGAMRASLGRDVCGGELYAAHFLGADAACKLIKLVGSAPGASAAAQFPQAAAANKSVFFHEGGAPKSVREVYDWALRQPGGADTVRAVPAAVTPGLDDARVRIASAPTEEIQALMASVMNWQPKHSLFANLFGLNDNATPSSAMSFSPGLLGLLSDAKDSKI